MVVLSIFLIYDAALQVTSRRNAIQIIKTEAVVTFPTNDAAVCLVDRTQILRVNKPGVRAYHMRTAPLPGGRVEKSDISIWYESSRGEQKTNCDITGSPSSWDIVDTMTHELPFNLFAPPLPNFVLEHIFPGQTTRRRVKITYREDPRLDEYRYVLAADRYQQNNIRIKLNLPRGCTQDIISQVRCHRIRDNLVEPITVFRHPSEDQHEVLVVEVKTLRGRERLRLEWPRFPTAESLPLVITGPARL